MGDAQLSTRPSPESRSHALLYSITLTLLGELWKEKSPSYVLHSILNIYCRYWYFYWNHNQNYAYKIWSSYFSDSEEYLLLGYDAMYFELACSLLLGYLFPRLILWPSRWDSTFLRNVGKLLPDYTVWNPRRQHCSSVVLNHLCFTYPLEMCV
jgi:hypothetical protein